MHHYRERSISMEPEWETWNKHSEKQGRRRRRDGIASKPRTSEKEHANIRGGTEKGIECTLHEKQPARDLRLVNGKNRMF